MVADQELANQVDVYEKQLAGLEAEMAEARARVEASQAKLERLKNKNTAVAAQVAYSTRLSFDRCKSLVAVVLPDLPLEILDLRHEIFEDKLVKPKPSAPLEEAEIVFEHPPASEEEENIESGSLEESETLSDI